MIRKLLLSIAGISLLVVSAVLWPAVRVDRLNDHFSKVEVNDSKDSVLKLMGAPWKDEKCGAYLGGQPAGCVEDFIYAHPYAPYVPEYWMIDFDSHQRVINKVQLVSP